MKKILLLTAGVLMVAVSCNHNSNNGTPESEFVKISPVITKVTDTNFETGDRIGLTITTENSTYAENKPLTYDGTLFKGELKWYSEALESSTLTAYYPYNEAAVPSTFSVLSDQSAGLSTSDLVAGVKSGVTPSADAITLPFKHLLTKILLEIDNQSGESISTVLLRGSKTTADVNLAELKAGASAEAETHSIKAFKSSESLYSAIVVPQKVAFVLAITTANGKELTQNLTSTDLQGGGQYTIKVKILPEDVKVSISGEIENWTDKGEISIDEPEYIEFEEHDGYFIYKNEKYTTKTFSDGSTWMTQPLRYVPEGYTVSTDPVKQDHIWAPYTIVNGEAVASTDKALVEKHGYLYDYDAIFGESVTKDNAATFEGKQGICPTGWHVPTRAEYVALCGFSNRSITESGTLTDENALLWDKELGYGSVVKADELGWNHVFSGYRQKNNDAAAAKYFSGTITEDKTDVDSYVGQPMMTFYASSTFYNYNQNSTSNSLQFFGMATTFTTKYPLGSLSLMYIHAESGLQLRCIKNK